MTDSSDSLKTSEVTEDDIKKLTQLTDVTARDVMNAISSESEQRKLSGTKLSNQVLAGTYSSKISKHKFDDDNENIEKRNPIPEDTYLKLPIPPDCGFPSTKESTTNPLKTDTVTSRNENESSIQLSNENQVEMVPESMYSVLQQRAQNVLKMISEKKCPESNPLNLPDQCQTLTVNIPNQSSSRQSLSKSNESTNLKPSKTSNLSFNNLSARISSTKSKEHPVNEVLSSQSNKQEHVPKKLSYTTVQHADPILPESDNVSTPHESKNQFVPTSESEQSSRSTEQCTTDYCARNIPAVENVQIPNESSKHDTPVDLNELPLSQNGKLTQQCTPIGENVPANEIGQGGVNQHTNDMIKELSEIINSNETAIKLSKKGELISQLFKEKFLLKLEATGNLDERSAEVANLTAAKFAQWMEEILKEIDTRKKNSASEIKKEIDLSEIKEEKDDFSNSESSKESVTNKEDLAQTNQDDDTPEVIKIQELSDAELIEKYGTHLLKDSKHELFQFIGPDNVPVEVRHLTTVESKKVMIVKKKTSDTNWSNWIIEVGPDVTLESVSGSVSLKLENEDTDKNRKETDAGIWNLAKFAWDKWKPGMFKEITEHSKVPLLKKQCMWTEADFDIEYPTYPNPFISAQYEKTTLNGHIVISHESKPSGLKNKK